MWNSATVLLIALLFARCRR